MEIQENIVNKVAESGLISYDLASLHTPGKRVLYDIKDLLFQELLLREKEFRAFIKTQDWSVYTKQHVAITCSNDAIVPSWAYMLLGAELAPYAATVVFGNLETLETVLYDRAIEGMDFNDLRNQKVIVKGCGSIYVPNSAFVRLSVKLKPIVRSLMYGEACATVPIYKNKT